MAIDFQIVTEAGPCCLTDELTVTGTELLCQKFVLELLTEKGSMFFLKQRGCDFLRRIRQAKTEMDIWIAFAGAKAQVRRNLAADENGFTPLAERFAGATINHLFIEDDAVTLEIHVHSRAKTYGSVILPTIKL
jgi:hypothetical protein